jgi:hypothetical protein
VSLALTRLQNFVYEQANNLDAQELRTTQTPVLDKIFVPDTQRLLDPEILNAVRGSANRVRQIPVIQDPRAGITIGNSVTCTIPDSRNTSAMYAVTYVPYTFHFVQYPAEFQNNYISEQRDFNVKLAMRLDQLKRAIETQCINTLNTNRNQVWNPSTLGPYTQIANALRVPLAGQNVAFNNFTPILAANDFNAAGVNVAAGFGIWPQVMFWMNQSTGNAQNTAFQFGNYNFNFTSRIAPGVNSNGAGYFMPQGTVGILDWLPSQYTAQPTNYGDKEWMRQFIPQLGMEMGVYMTRDCADVSGAYPAGIDDPAQSATPRLTWQFVIYIATIVAYNSNIATRVSPIFRFEFNNT